jgi:DNA-binding SARP family transcriptional activator
MRKIELFLLGGFELRIDGGPVRLQPAGRRLLALLALSDRRLSRSFVAFQLWPDTVEGRALASLRSTLWRLGELADVVLEVSPTQLTLSPQVWLDVRHGIQMLVDGDESAAALPFSAFQSELLPDWYDDWLAVERERMRQLSLRILTARASAALARSETLDAIQLALGALSIEPHHAGAHDVLTSAHLAEGNTYESKREQERFDSLALV